MVTTDFPEKFKCDGFVNWLRKYDICAEANGWNAISNLAKLPSILCGPVFSYFNTLTADQKDTYDILTASLQALLCILITTEQHFQDFKSCSLRPEEDPALYVY